MATIELKQISLENYKKFETAEYQFAPRTMVSGRNQQGKSTLMDAYFDTLTGKLADGTSPNSVRRKENGEEVEGVVARELTLLIDGEETVIRKETKKGKSSSTTNYQVDGFDYNQTKYKEFLKNIADSKILLMCSNAKAFLNELQKSTAEARKTLTDMSGFDTDAFVRNNSEIMQITKGHSVEETAKQLKKNKKKKQEDIKDKDSKIEVIKGQSIPDIHLLEEKKNIALDKLNVLLEKEKQLNEANKAYDELSSEILGLKKSRDAIISDATEVLQDEKRKIVSLLNDRRFKQKQEEENLRVLENFLATADNPERIQQRIKALQEKYKQTYAYEFNETTLKSIQGEKFNPKSIICPTCGQELPEEQVYRLEVEFEQKQQERISTELAKKEQFEANKQQKLKDITEEGNAEVARRKEVEEKRKDIESQIEQTKKNIATLISEIAQKNQELEKLPTEPEMSGNTEYQAVVAEIQKKQEQLDGLTNNSEEKAELSKEKADAEKELAGIEKEIEMQKQAVQKQTETIEQLNADRKKLAQEDSDIQQKLDLLKEFSIKKNQALAEAINPHFKHFQFVFLDYTADGEPVETCKMICDGIGYFDGLNHSDQILCNIDLVVGLQELNGLNLPIWVDDTESVNAERIPDTGRQMILLKVSDEELKIERM